MLHLSVDETPAPAQGGNHPPAGATLAAPGAPHRVSSTLGFETALARLLNPPAGARCSTSGDHRWLSSEGVLHLSVDETPAPAQGGNHPPAGATLAAPGAP
ncbi:hypothetical protein, partial [Nocardioides abyssi]